MPNLRDRKGDIPLLVNFFLKNYNEEKRCDVSLNSEDVMNVLMGYEWPGNVRELENLIQRLVILKGKGNLEIKDLPPKLFQGSMARLGISRPSAPVINNQTSLLQFILPEAGLDLRELMNNFEDHILNQALGRTGGNKNKASELLRMNRTTLVEKLKKKQLPVIQK
jgi:DNA-binding NtrC family response regulator